MLERLSTRVYRKRLMVGYIFKGLLLVIGIYLIFGQIVTLCTGNIYPTYDTTTETYSAVFKVTRVQSITDSEGTVSKCIDLVPELGGTPIRHYKYSGDIQIKSDMLYVVDYTMDVLSCDGQLVLKCGTAKWAFGELPVCVETDLSRKCLGRVDAGQDSTEVFERYIEKNNVAVALKNQRIPVVSAGCISLVCYVIYAIYCLSTVDAKCAMFEVDMEVNKNGNAMQ